MCKAKLFLVSSLLGAASLVASGCVTPAPEDDPIETDDPAGDGDTGGDDGSGDDGTETDDGSGDPGDDQDLGCAAGASYSALIEPEAELVTDEEGDTYLELFAELSESPLNELEVSLWNDAGAFAGGEIGPGSYTIAGDETSYEDCGVCVVIYGDVDPATDVERQLLMAQSGTVEIDSVDGTMSGELIDVVLEEVDPITGAPVAGGCETRVSTTFSSPIL